jgi:WD40 repeat protein
MVSTMLPQAIALAPGGRYLAGIGEVWTKAAHYATTSGDGFLALWDLSADLAPAVVPVTNGTCLRFSPDGKRLAIAGHQGVAIWDVAGLKKAWSFPFAVTTTRKLQGASSWGRSGDGPTTYVFWARCVQFSPDGRQVFAGTKDGRIALGDLETGEERATWQAHKEAVLSLALSPDGKLLASGGQDRMVRLWDPTCGDELARWEAHADDVTALAFSPDGKDLVSGCNDGTVKFWDLPLIHRELAAVGLDW